MFRSRTRAIIVPQAEHARLAGTIAYHWGSDRIAPPPLDSTTFALGVTIHDRGYGEYDELGIGDVDDKTWLATQRRGLELRHPDPIADTVALFHLHRLVSSRDDEQARLLAADIDAAIDENLSRSDVDRRIFEEADSITAICDLISFHLCFGQSAEFVGSVYAPNARDRRDSIAVTIHHDGEIHLDPWPLARTELSGFILGYAPEPRPVVPTDQGTAHRHVVPCLVEYLLRPA